MSIRTIMIFPEFEEMEIIEEIREKYDPLAHLVRPHITIVFPFENQMSNKDIADILADRLITIPPFELVLNGISKHEDRFGNYLFLNVKKGSSEICTIHNILYDNEFCEPGFICKGNPFFFLRANIIHPGVIYLDVRLIQSFFKFPGNSKINILFPDAAAYLSLVLSAVSRINDHDLIINLSGA